jgi:hypothetical protein
MILSPLLVATWDGGGLPPKPWWFDLLFSVAVLGFAGVPVAIGFAVLKYRLYDIDIVINRALVYGSLTATLLALYFGASRRPRLSSAPSRARSSNRNWRS